MIIREDDTYINTLWSKRITHNTGLGTSPYALVYGKEANCIL